MTELGKLRDDAPGTSAEQDDRLGYSQFADRVAKALTAVDYQNGFVFGLNGVWGSGKTTLLNFIVEQIEKDNANAAANDKVIVVKFEPWLVSGHHDLIGAYFKVLSEAFPAVSTQSGRWKLLGFRFGQAIANPAIDAAAAVGTLYDPSAGIGARAVATIAKNTLDGRLKAWMETPSLQKSYANLRKALMEQKRRIVVMIDDVDRLSRAEIRYMMQMVKSVGRLPFVTYVLAYDSRILRAALKDEDTPQGGPRYEEKIIQHEVQLPLPARSALLAILDDQIQGFLQAPRSKERFNSFIMYGLHNWIRTPRDTVRLANALQFSWSALEGEFDPDDLLAMEGLRLFEPAAFNWIRSNRPFFFGEALMTSDERTAFAASFRDEIKQEGKGYVLEILGRLFPARSKEICGDHHHIGEMHYETARRFGMGAQVGYDTYFSLFPPLGEFSKSRIDGLVSKLDDENAIRVALDEAISHSDRSGVPVISDLLEALRYRMLDPDRVMPTPQLLAALMGALDSILSIDMPVRFFVGPPYGQAASIFSTMVESWGNSKALEEFTKIAKNSDSTLAAAFLCEMVSDRGKSENDPKHLTATQSLKLARIMVARIRKEAARGTLQSAVELWPIIHVWKRIAKPDEIKTWITKAVKADADIILKLPILSEVSSGSEVRYVLRNTPDPAFYDMRLIRIAAKSLLSDASTSQKAKDQARAILGNPTDVFGDPIERETPAEQSAKAPEPARKRSPRRVRPA